MARRPSIPRPTARVVLARSGGYCANPSCHNDLFPKVLPGPVATVDNLAHIIGQSRKGPRGDDPLPLEYRNDPANIILFCGYCHDQADDVNASDTYSIEKLREWKRNHERRVRHGASTPQFETREELDSEVSRLLRENKGIWRNLGPESPAARDPFGEGAEIWRQQVRDVILPNNGRIVDLIDANAALLRNEELERFEDFRVHAAYLEFNYTQERRGGAPRFPEGFEEIFQK